MKQNDDEPVDVASSISFCEHLLLLENFAILPEYQSRGLATIFCELAIEKMRSQETHVSELVQIPTATNVHSAATAGFLKTTTPGFYL